MRSVGNYPFSTIITYGGDYPDWNYEGELRHDPTLHRMAGKYPIMYNDPNHTFRLKMATNKIIWTTSKIICQKTIYPTQPTVQVAPKMDTFALMAHHNCLRDKASLKTIFPLLNHIICSTSCLVYLLVR